MDVPELLETDIASVNRVARTFSMHLASKLGVDPEDVCQEAMIKFISKPSGTGKLSCWLWKTVKSVALDALRKQARDKKCRAEMCVHKFAENLLEGPNEDQMSQVQASSARVRPQPEPDEMPMLQDMLRKLPLEQRRVLVLVAAGYRYAEIAAATDVSIGTVRSRLHHARRKAQSQLAQYYGGESA